MRYAAYLLLPFSLAAQMQTGDGIWVRNAYYGEIQTFDPCLGHQPQTGQYHHHASPICLRAQLDDNVEAARKGRMGTYYREKATPARHSPVLGYAYDGFPIYGPYGYSDPRSPISQIRRMKTGFRLKALTTRTNGPAINVEFPLGRYIQDYEFVDGLGDLDVYNGRFAVTPEYPAGSYAYYITIDANGTPEFPYILSAQYYGTFMQGRAQAVPATALDYSVNTAPAPELAAWKASQSEAQVISAFNPAAGAKSTWPNDVPTGLRVAGGVTTATKADVQRIRVTDTTMYLNAAGLASYTMGPWFDPLFTAGYFGNYPSDQASQVQIARRPAAATTKTAVGMGAVGMWVNGVAVFNYLDGASYSQATGTDAGGGTVRQTAVHISSASGESGPVAPGSLISAYSLFGSDLRGGVVTIRDSANASHQAVVSYSAAGQVNYRMPLSVAVGTATITIASGGKSYAAGAYITSVYPHLFEGSFQTRTAAGDVYITLYGTGRGTSSLAAAKVGGVDATVSFAGPQGQYDGLDQYNILLARGASGRLQVDLMVNGVAANPVFIEVQ